MSRRRAWSCAHRRAPCAGCGASTAIAERLTAAALLAAALYGIRWFMRPGWPHNLSNHMRWIVRAAMAFVAPALLALLALGRMRDLAALPNVFEPLAGRLPMIDPLTLLPTLATGLPVGAAIVQLWVWWARWRGRPLPRHIIAAAPLAARNRRDLLPATATAIAAGIFEEWTFRLTLPLLIALVTGSAILGFAGATALFVALHRYQPWYGMVLVGFLGIGFTLLYLATGSLWLAMLCHATIDIMALAIRPWMAGFGASSSAASRS